MLYSGVYVTGELAVDQVLTQYGNRAYPPGEPFRNMPRAARKETDISLLAGRMSVDEAARSVNPRRTEGAHPSDGVRYTTVRTLRAAGFQVEASPSALIPGHVSVTLGSEGDWTDDVRAKLDACFTETTWKEEHDE
jgi:hypothetical protein